MQKPQKYLKLREKLPHRYGKIIAERLVNITPLQVKLVFIEHIKDPEIVNKIISEAFKIISETEEIEKMCADLSEGAPIVQ